MDEIIYLVILVLGAALVMPIIALVIAAKTRGRAERLEAEVGRLREIQARSAGTEARLIQRLDLLEALSRGPLAGSETLTGRQTEIKAPPTSPPKVAEPAAAVVEAAAPPPIPPRPLPETVKAAAAPPVPQVRAVPSVPSLPPSEVTWEQFMGAKLFAWVGGLALFLGIIFFVKLSIERGWISPELRTAIGFAVGTGLLCGGVVMRRQARYTTLANALCATGIVILYGVTFAAHALWRIPPLDQALVAFLVMALITVAAFLLAVRMNAQVVAVLGMLGGFLTPILCSTGRDQPLGLFTYIALLDIGVLAVARHKRWLHLTGLAALGTIFMQAGWMAKFFHVSHYAIGPATWVPVAVFLGFALLFTLAAWWTRQQADEDMWPAAAALALGASALAAAFVFLFFGGITERPVLLYTFVLGVNGAVMLAVWHERRIATYYPLFAAATFIHLMAWTSDRLTQELLPYALGIYLAFGVLHTAFAVLMGRRAPQQASITAWMPVTTLLLLLMPVFCLDAMSLAIWPVILIVDLLVIALAVMSGMLLPVLAALVLTLFTAAGWLFRWPGELSMGLLPFLVVIGGFAVLFGGVGSFIFRRLPKAKFAPLLPVSSAVLPFLLLILATLQLRIANPSPVFGLALLLAVFLLGLVRISGFTVLAPTALGCVLALEWAWHGQSFDVRQATTPLLWYLGFYVLFTAFPFMFQKQFATRRLPWVTSAAAGLGTFSLVYRLVGQTWPNEMMGLLPAAFSLAPLACLVFVLGRHPVDNPARLTQLAWFCGVALFFITLIFPIQFEKQWITIGWALEGAALCWLFLRVPHPGLRATGTGLLLASFVRLALNPAVLDYQPRGDAAILNWQLYAYGITALALFLAAKWVTPSARLWDKVNLRGLFCALGGILLFLLLNIEIADVFTPPGSRSIAFDFGGNLARDMTYSIAWALFALTLLILGIWQRNPPTRYAGIGLLVITLLKLFLHDLANIESGYRIGALIGVAVIALVASFLYQRFLTHDKS